MVSQTAKKRDGVRKLDSLFTQDSGEPLTSYQIALAAKAALEDFVGSKTSVQAVREVSKLLHLALKARMQYLSEELDLTSGKTPLYY